MLPDSFQHSLHILLRIVSLRFWITIVSLSLSYSLLQWLPEHLFGLWTWADTLDFLPVVVVTSLSHFWPLSTCIVLLERISSAWPDAKKWKIKLHENTVITLLPQKPKRRCQWNFSVTPATKQGCSFMFSFKTLTLSNRILRENHKEWKRQK